MTKEEAEKYAENMTYREAIYNLKQAKSVPYRKATFIKINELLDKLEQDKPMVEIDLYSVIKQKYIEREVLDKIRAEIEQTYETDIGFLIHDETKRTILNIIDKYKAESEVNNGTDIN